MSATRLAAASGDLGDLVARRHAEGAAVPAGRALTIIRYSGHSSASLTLCP
jgi:hypothetical protein